MELIKDIFENFRKISSKIINYSNLGIPRIDFLRKILHLLIDFSECDSVELWISDSEKYIHFEISQETDNSCKHEMIMSNKDESGVYIPSLKKDSINNRLVIDTIRGQFDSSIPYYTEYGSFWSGDIKESFSFLHEFKPERYYQDRDVIDNYKSIALIPIFGREENIGLIQLISAKVDFFSEDIIEFYENLSQIIGFAVINQRSRAALRERIKEITCLYNIAQVEERQNISFHEILQNIAELLPPAWQYPEVTSGRIILDGNIYSTPGFQENMQKQTSDIIVNGIKRGVVEVVYIEDKPELDEGPFLKEERSLIDAITREISHIAERKDEEENKSKLQEQLRHADRLATIGQLAAGVAHELNEPLNSILGFAQLTKKNQGLPVQASQDILKIETASLHAREVIKKLMLFSRQSKPEVIRLNLNEIVEEGLYFFKSRCDKAGIKIEYLLSQDLPQIIGDPTQLNQVLVNLVVNSIQAMPDGGKLTIKTMYDKKYVYLIVEDTGVGMDEDIIKDIFMPFFTTKPVNEGTGLGLAVVHGIVTAHKGFIDVVSTIGKGTCFNIKLPIMDLEKRGE